MTQSQFYIWMVVLSAIGVSIPLIKHFGKGLTWVGRVNASLETLTKSVDVISKDIKRIFRRLPSSTVAGESPLRLTELGKEIAVGIKAKPWAIETEPLLRDRAKGKRPDEIQDLCFEYVRHEYEPSPEMEVEIKVAAYENGIDTYQVLDVLAVVLRDRLLVDIVDSDHDG